MLITNVRILRKFIHNVRCKWEKGTGKVSIRSTGEASKSFVTRIITAA